MAKEPDVTEVFFESMSINEGDYNTGIAEDGTRYTFQTVRRSWYVMPIVVLSRILCGIGGGVVEWALNRGVKMEYVKTHGGGE